MEESRSVASANDVFAVNEEFGVGFRGDGFVSNLSIIKNQRQYTDSEKPKVLTIFQLELPFCLHGIDGNHGVGGIIYNGEKIDAQLRITTQMVPPDVAKYSTRMTTIQSSGITLRPDNLGRANYTLAHVFFMGFLPILYEQLSPEQKEIISQSGLDESNLEFVCELLNKTIDKYCIATKNFGIRRIVPKELILYQVWQDFLGEDNKHNLRVVYFKGVEVSLQQPQSLMDKNIIEAMKEIGVYSEQDRRIQYILLDAYRSMETKRIEYASVQAAIALEMALNDFIKGRALAMKDSSGRSLISKNHLDDVKKDVGLAILLKVLLPLVLKPDEIIDPKIINGCDTIRNQRNYVVHNESSKFDPLKVIKNIDKVEQLINWLRQTKSAIITP